MATVKFSPIPMKMARVLFSLLTLTVLSVSTGAVELTDSTAELTTESTVESTTESTVAGDQVLVACTRQLPSILGQSLDLNEFSGYTCGVHGDPCGERVSLRESEGYTSTWIFVHGNQIPQDEAVRRGVAVYRRVRACAADHGPIRFVIWSWPSERTTGRLRDAQIKRCRTDVESFLLGSYIAAIAPDTPVRFVGYSFGARIVSGALHLASGGQLGSCGLGDAVEPVTPYRVAFLAPAVESDGLQSCGRYRHALDYADHVLLMNNSRDRALRFFWTTSSSRPKALGHVGASCRPAHVTLQQYDWAKQFGKDHRLWLYLDHGFIVGKLADVLEPDGPTEAL